MEFLTREKYNSQVKRQGMGAHWRTMSSRWDYHQKATELVKGIDFRTMLEIGTMGVKVWDNSDTLDFFIQDAWKVNSLPTYYHDLEVLPYPIPKKYYDVVVALRVFHHMKQSPQIYFNELRRIAKHIILALPVSHNFNIGTPVTKIMKCKFETMLIYWKC